MSSLFQHQVDHCSFDICTMCPLFSSTAQPLMDVTLVAGGFFTLHARSLASASLKPESDSLVSSFGSHSSSSESVVLLSNSCFLFRFGCLFPASRVRLLMMAEPGSCQSFSFNCKIASYFQLLHLYPI